MGYTKTYAGLFHHVPDACTWAEYNGLMILPHEFRKPAGRPASVRIRTTMDEGHEVHRSNRCSNCKQLGHNKSHCHNQPAPSSSTR